MEHQELDLLSDIDRLGEIKRSNKNIGKRVKGWIAFSELITIMKISKKVYIRLV